MIGKALKTFIRIRVILGLTALVLAVLIPAVAYRPKTYTHEIRWESGGRASFKIGRGRIWLEWIGGHWIDRNPRIKGRTSMGFRKGTYLLRIPGVFRIVKNPKEVTSLNPEITRFLKPMPIDAYFLRTEAFVPAALLGSFALLLLVPGPVRKYVRRRRGLCLHCGYNLTGNTSGTCSECGEAI